MECINKDHDAVGAHDLDGQPFDPACEYPSCYAWAKATGQDPAFVAALKVDHERNWGKRR